MKLPREEREMNRRNIWSNNDRVFPQINVRHQSIDPARSENTKQDKCQKKPPKKQKMKETTRHVILKMQKSKDKEKLKRNQGKKHLI